MSSPINKEVLEHLAGLARIELDPKEEDKFLRDLQDILAYFEELKTANTEGVSPQMGNDQLKNIFRDDAARRSTLQGRGKDDFPDSRDGFLIVPKVFE